MSDPAAVESPEIRPPALNREDRRKIRRVGVALQIRICNADSQDGDFEEVRTTLNASRKGVYFFSPLSGYYKGMKLRITFPYDAQASSNLEQRAEVIRVHRRGAGFGVAVALNTESETALSSRYAHAPVILLASQELARTGERRCAKRTPFVAPVELIDVGSGSRIKARIADLSLHGCYVDTLNPLPVASRVRLQIQKTSEVLELWGNVSSQHPGSGMGVEFGDITAEQRVTLKSWLAEASPTVEIGFTKLRPSARPHPAADMRETFAIRLMNALVRKGILTKSEASELLRDPEL